MRGVLARSKGLAACALVYAVLWTGFSFWGEEHGLISPDGNVDGAMLVFGGALLASRLAFFFVAVPLLVHRVAASALRGRLRAR